MTPNSMLGISKKSITDICKFIRVFILAKKEGLSQGFQRLAPGSNK